MGRWVVDPGDIVFPPGSCFLQDAFNNNARTVSSYFGLAYDALRDLSSDVWLELSCDRLHGRYGEVK